MTSETPTLLVLAAGLGARYGGLKQLESVGPGGETLMDYAVYDAVRSGFGRVVFLIRRDIADAFEQQIGSRYSGQVAVDYAFQELSDLPDGFSVPDGRERPWGTGHAAWAARDVVGDAPFAVINADDFYGAETFQRLAENFSDNDVFTPSDKLTCAMAGFRLSETLSEHGTVSRGVCETTDGYLGAVAEWTGIGRDAAGQISGFNGTGKRRPLAGDETASMNVWGFPKGVFLEKSFANFLLASEDLSTAEFYLPVAVDEWIHEGSATVRVRQTPCRWLGVTYKEDRPRVIEALARLVEDGVYPENILG